MSMSNVGPCRQRGISLIVILLLLLVMTLIGLAVLRTTVLQERMSANLRDRSLSFQTAEAALRDAEEFIRTESANGRAPGYDCTPAGRICPAIPDNTYTGNASGCSRGSENCWINATTRSQAVTGMIGQYYIQYIGERTGVNQEALGAGSSASQNQYGSVEDTSSEKYYRILARSSDPSGKDGRAFVVLQTAVIVN
ncbi:pilus assembly protein [Xylella taiwanensis]|uniref:PilX protein n=1 Tax=Xylella taiwanensis TaxID=1444770 RepID=Z9JNE0_9GAMM|nr:pilus assembly protein [Xylella taiwanensis]AXI82495.1 PilX protein [Xylella taiwanensis]EWS79272.1 PilX protein [Xylella taiwanensis]MCD8455487.1 pilus assembly protein [Xylella taiwanensis]MCD8457892.1 pilus assembly protein [Xylella taiwanensis]MCD8460027.1 pilus assembly protein [Xylella taiwanensis]